MAEAPVKVLKVSSMKPAIPTATTCPMFLSNVDLLFLPVKSVERLLFYPPPPPRDFSSVLQTLKSGLSSALVHFYPLAGRLVVGEDNRPHIDCNDAGVEFVEASTDFPFQELEMDDFQHKPIFKSLVHSLSDRKEEDDQPLLSVQVTFFGGGGVSIGFALNHVVADGKSIWHFMKSWAECSRGVPISAYPHHDRTLLRTDKLNNNNYVNYGLCFKDGTLYFEGDGSGRPSEGRKKHWELEERRLTLDEHPSLAYKTFHLSRERIEELKVRASGNGMSGPHSSFVSAAAHFWRCIMKARDVAPNEFVNIYMLADRRGRMNPPLPLEFFGNCLQFTGARTTAGELFGHELSFAAGLIQKAVNSCTDKNFKAMVNWVEDSVVTEDVRKGCHVEVVASPRFGLYEIDYGWGRAVQVQAASFNAIGQMLVYPGRDGVGSFDVSTCLPPLQMELFSSLFISGTL